MFNHSSTIRELQQTCSPPPFFFFLTLLTRSAVAQRCADCPSAPGQLPQRPRLGGIHWRCGAVAQQKPGGPHLHAVGIICSEERSCYRQGQLFLNSGSFSLSFIMCFHTKFSLCVFIETSPRLAGCSSVSPVCSSGVFWVQTLLKGQRAATKIWKVSHWLESTLNSSFLACVQLQTKTPISFPATCFCIFLVLAAFSV